MAQAEADSAPLNLVVRYLGWLSIRARTFNVGSYRRQDTPQPTADFFDTSNKEGERMRHAAAEAAVKDMLKWFKTDGGTVAILDATNSTKARRRWVRQRCEANGIETLYVESKCDSEETIMANIMEVKTTSPDYLGQDPEAAALDFRNRIRNYEKVYQTIDEDEKDLTYVKLIDVGKQVIINRIQDYLQSRVVYYLMNLHIRPRSIWLSRVSLSPPQPFSHTLTIFSTANRNSTSLAESAATPTFPDAANSTPVRSPSLSLPPSVTTASSQSGPPPSNAQSRRPDSSPRPQKATTSSSGKP